MKNVVLDSYAVLVFLFQQKGSERVLDLLEKAANADKALLIGAPNWAEVRYIVDRKAGRGTWAEVRDKLLGLPIEIVPADRDLAEIAGEIKAANKMSLADCFAAALAKKHKADLVTGDKDFKPLEGEIKIRWL